MFMEMFFISLGIFMEMEMLIIGLWIFMEMVIISPDFMIRWVDRICLPKKQKNESSQNWFPCH